MQSSVNILKATELYTSGEFYDVGIKDQLKLFLKNNVSSKSDSAKNLYVSKFIFSLVYIK